MCENINKTNKILILSANTGQGHNSVAQALKDEFDYRNIESVIEDSIRFVSDGVSKVISKGHETLYINAPKLFASGYKFTEEHATKLLGEKSAVYKLLSVGAKKLYEFICNGKYDAVICTHVFSALMLTEVKRKFELNILTSYISTDYCIHPSLDETGLDLYFIPDEELRSIFNTAVRSGDIITSGISVRRTFLNKTEKNTAKQMLGIDVNKKHIMIMCGSMGCGPIKNIVEELAVCIPQDTVATVICGRNDTLAKKLSLAVKEANKENQILVKGFVDNISLLMDSADIYITKPGGISVTEAAIKRLPLILLDVVAGCEEHNLKFFVDKNMAITDTNENIVRIALSTLNNSDKINSMSNEYAKREYEKSAQIVADYLTLK